MNCINNCGSDSVHYGGFHGRQKLIEAGSVPMDNDPKDNRYEVRVRHHVPGPHRYTWHIHRRDKVLPINESRTAFRSWEEANKAGKAALNRIARARSSLLEDSSDRHL